MMKVTTKQAWALCAMLVLILLLMMFTQHLVEIQQSIQATNSAIKDMAIDIQQNKQEIEGIGIHMDGIIDRVRDLEDRSRQWDKQDRGGEQERRPEPEQKLTYLGEYNVTGYCSCEKCCGEWAKNRPAGKVYGAAGEELTPGISVAGWLPLGSRIMINGQEYIVQDRTAKRIRDKYDGKIIDIYCGSHDEAWNIGNQKHEVWLVE